MSKQTAVEWLVKQLLANGDIRWRGTAIHDLAEQAKAMGQRQIEDAWNSAYGGDANHTGEQYFNETYGGGK